MSRRLSILALALSAVSAGCTPPSYNPARATRPYPLELHTTDTVDVQVFREETNLVIVNCTARSYRDFDIWVNQRFTRHVESCAAGQTLTLSLWDFFDERGDVFNAGGFWRSTAATPVRLVQVQPSPEEPLVGLITIRAENEY